jgi:hypothetical protein
MLREHYDDDRRQDLYTDRRSWDGIERRQIVEHIEHFVEPPKEKKPIIPLSAMIPILYALLSGVFVFAWNMHDKQLSLEYNIKQLADKFTDHEKDDIEFKQNFKDIKIEIDKLEKQLLSYDSTLIELMANKRK